MQLEQITIRGVRKYSGLDEPSVEGFYRADNNVLPLLKDAVISPFEQALKDASGYDSNNLPEKEQLTVQELGDITFTITSKQRTKRPKHAEVYEGLQGFLGFVKESYDDGVQRKGVLTIDGQGYVALEEVRGKVRDLQTEVTVPEVTHSLSYEDKRQHPTNGVNPVSVPIARGVSLTPGDAQLYVAAKALYDSVHKKTVKPFKEALLTETGYSKHNVPKDTDVKWTQIGSHLLRVRTVPEDTVSYGKIMDDLAKEAPKKPNRRSVIGDFVRLRDGLPLGEAEVLYQPRTRDGQTFVLIEGALTRLEQLKEKHTTPSVNQSIKHYPAV
jgi:hypothetical protein